MLAVIDDCPAPAIDRLGASATHASASLDEAAVALRLAAQANARRQAYALRPPPVLLEALSTIQRYVVAARMQ